MGEFDFENKEWDVDSLLADVKELLDETDAPCGTGPAEGTAEARQDDAAALGTGPAGGTAEARQEISEEDAAEVPMDETIIFRPLTAYEQSRPEYQTARRAEYAREREKERQQRQSERERRAAEEDERLRELEGRRKKRRGSEAPRDTMAYSEWLYEQGGDDETQRQREEMAQRLEDAAGKQKKRTGRKARRGHAWVRVVLVLAALVVLGAGFFHFIWVRQPKGEAGSMGARKSGCSTILLAGTDAGGYRTDTMLLLNIDREEGAMSLVSIPRDTLVYCEYSVPKLNSAYGWAGGGEEGMEELLTRVEEIIGFRPDGYVLIDLDCFAELVDQMGGVTFDVPVEMHYSDPSQNLTIDLAAGEQKLDGEAAMQLVRFRSGYADADLGRVKVQRDFLTAALGQWASVTKVYKLPTAIKLVLDGTKTDLSSANLGWLAESALLCGTETMTMETLPGEAAWIGGGSYYVLDAEKVAAVVNGLLNPYEKEITTVDLSIRVG